MLQSPSNNCTLLHCFYEKISIVNCKVMCTRQNLSLAAVYTNLLCNDDLCLFWLEESVSAVYSDWLRGKSETKSCSWSAADVWRQHLELLHIICTPGAITAFTYKPGVQIVWSNSRCCLHTSAALQLQLFVSDLPLNQSEYTADTLSSNQNRVDHRKWNFNVIFTLAHL